MGLLETTMRCYIVNTSLAASLTPSNPSLLSWSEANMYCVLSLKNTPEKPYVVYAGKKLCSAWVRHCWGMPMYSTYAPFLPLIFAKWVLSGTLPNKSSEPALAKQVREVSPKIWTHDPPSPTTPAKRRQSSDV